MEKQLERRQRLGKAVSVSALTASLLVSAVGCPAADPADPLGGETETETVEQLIGEVTVPSDVIEGGIGESTDGVDDFALLGQLPLAPTEEDDWELTGDFAIVEETTENNG